VGIDDLANSYVDDWAALEPVGATYVGIDGHDDKMTDLSPEGFAALADLDRRTLAQLDAVQPADERERVAQEAMRERLELALARYDAGEVTSELNVISSALHGVRSVFDLMPLEGEPAAANIAKRLAAVPTALRQYQRTLLGAADAGHVSARHQILEVAKQCDVWTDEQGDNFFPGLVERVETAGDLPDSLRAELASGAAAAREATAAFGTFLREELAARGSEKQAVGRDRYALASQFFLGARVDLDETYAWGFEELARLEAEMRRVADKIVPGGSVDQADEALDRASRRSPPGAR
jgi:uncharacterized protein (DUF885 family)